MRVLITGGASGIGLATVQLFEELGASVALLDRAVVNEQRRSSLHPTTICVQADIGDDSQVLAAASQAVSRLGGLDVLVNNAGIGAQGDISTNTDAEWFKVLNVNLVGLVRVTRAVLPALRASSAASIVNVCSVAATVGLPNRALYSASKGAILSLTLATAADLVADGIRVNCVNPGTADTPWVQNLLNDSIDPTAERIALEQRQPHGRLVTAQEVARAIAYLASPLSGSTTGTSLAVDGGMAGLRTRPRASGIAKP